MRKRIIHQIAVLFIALSYFTAGAAGEMNFCNTKPFCFPVIGTAEQPALAAEVHGGFYGKHTTDGEIRTKLQGLPEKDKLAIPEYLILKELEITKTGTLNEFLSNYHGADSKEYARSLVSDFGELKKHSRKVTQLSFQCKVRYEELVRIRYQRRYEDGTHMQWSSILKKIDGRYYFVNLDPEHIFHDIAQGLWQFRDRGTCTKDSLASLQKVSFVAKDAQYPLAAYIQPISSENGDQLVLFLERWVKACQEGTIEDIVSFYSTEAAQPLRQELSFDPEVLKDFRNKFSGIERVDANFMVKGKSKAAISITPVKDGKKGKVRFVLIDISNDKPGIAFPGSSIAIEILRHDKVKAQLEKPNAK